MRRPHSAPVRGDMRHNKLTRCDLITMRGVIESLVVHVPNCAERDKTKRLHQEGLYARLFDILEGSRT